MRTVSSALGALAAAAVATSALAQDAVKVGQLVDYTGPTSFVGTQYGPGVADALAYINSKGGVGGITLDVDTVDYAYKVPEAVGQYRRWQSGGMIAMQGWGTADTEALISFVAKDQIPVWSASYSAHLTDPLGTNPKTERPAPFNFFYGPSYSDACRALVQWAWGDAQAKASRRQSSSTPATTTLTRTRPRKHAPSMRLNLASPSRRRSLCRWLQATSAPSA